MANSPSGGDIYGRVSGSNNLIDDASTAGGFTNGVNGNIVGVSPLLASLGNYGGPTQTMPPLPGSPVIGGGSTVLIPAGITTDQRGEPRIVNGTVDIGAFESQGFTLTPVAGSTPQGTPVNSPFANPLAVIVTANNPLEPVAGGVVTFSAPASGASANLSASSPVTIGSNGQASVTATANAIGGQYTVSASTAGAATPADFALTNTAQPALSDLAGPTIVYGTSTVTLSGTILAGSTVPPGSVSITLDGDTQSAAIGTSGSFSGVFNTASLGVAGSPSPSPTPTRPATASSGSPTPVRR